MSNKIEGVYRLCTAMTSAAKKGEERAFRRNGEGEEIVKHRFSELLRERMEQDEKFGDWIGRLWQLITQEMRQWGQQNK